MFTYYRSAYNCLMRVHHQITVSNIPGQAPSSETVKRDQGRFIRGKVCELRALLWPQSAVQPVSPSPPPPLSPGGGVGG